MGLEVDPRSAAFRLLPSVEEVLRDPALAELARGVPHDLWLSFVRESLDELRAAVRSGSIDADRLGRDLAGGALTRALADKVARERRRGLRPAINATGVVLHTGLGRAVVHPEAADAMRSAAAGYCILEVDRATGERNERDHRIGELLARLTGAEAGIAVNNNAAAVYLALSTFARGEKREVVVSRGELVEIGGSFRVPDVMERAGVTLREVGTTNRTRIADYAAAIGPRTALLMKVHTSNFRLEGFTEEAGAHEIAALAKERGLASAFDLGSGLLEIAGEPSIAGLESEPGVRAAVASGVDVVTFSGDKLLGAPQSGLVVGKRAAVHAMRKNPVYRALRLDKVTIAGLEKTLELCLAGRAPELPARAMLAATAESLRPVAERIARALDGANGLRARVEPGESQPGSGSAPGVFLPTFVVRVEHDRIEAGALAARLRDGEPPVFARVQDGALFLDPRTLLPNQVEALVGGVRTAAG